MPVLHRRKDGGYYVVKVGGENDFVTWQVKPAGVQWLRRLRVEVDHYFDRKLFWDLHEAGLVYTHAGGSTPGSATGLPPIPPYLQVMVPRLGQVLDGFQHREGRHLLTLDGGATSQADPVLRVTCPGTIKLKWQLGADQGVKLLPPEAVERKVVLLEGQARAMGQPLMLDLDADTYGRLALQVQGRARSGRSAGVVQPHVSPAAATPRSSEERQGCLGRLLSLWRLVWAWVVGSDSPPAT